MNQGHIKSGEVINLETLKGAMDVDASYALVKTPDMEVIRMALPKGKKVEEHQVAGEISVQCLKGNIMFKVNGKERNLKEHDWLYLTKKEPFCYNVHEDTILLVTFLFASNEDS